MRLLEVLGFGNCLDALNQQKEKENEDHSQIEQQRTGNSRNTMHLTRDYSVKVETTEGKRHPMADVYTKQWQDQTIEATRRTIIEE